MCDLRFYDFLLFTAGNCNFWISFTSPLQARSRDESRKDIEGSPAGRPRRGIEPIQKMEDQVDMRHGFSLQDQSVAVTARGSPSRDADAGVTRHGRRGSSHRDSESRSSKKYSHHGGGSHHHRSQDGKSC